MTVKGPHSIKPPSDESVNHKIPQKVQNGSGPPQTKSPPKDSNLNHYRSEKATPVSIVICLDEGLCDIEMGSDFTHSCRKSGNVQQHFIQHSTSLVLALSCQPVRLKCLL
jgi:hypothetical protein